MKIKALILSLFALSLIACDEDVPIKEGLVPTTGRFFVLDDAGTDGRTGWWPSMTLDKNEDPHLTYCDVYNGDLKYATRKNGHWHVDVVESKGAVGKYTALALDANDSPAIVFYDQDQKYLRYAWKDEENKWKTERIAWGLEVGMASELRFGHDGLPHLFYYVASGKMIHAVRTKAGVWDKKKIYDAGGGFSVEISPVLRKDGFWLTFVAWTLKDTTLFLARPDGEGGFKTEIVADHHGPGWRSYLHFEGDEPVVYHTQSYKLRLKISRKGKDGWDSRVIKRYAGVFAMAENSKGEFIMPFQDGTYRTGTLKLLRYKDKVWTQSVLDQAIPSGEYIAAVLDEKGRAVIAYYDGQSRSLKIYDETLPPIPPQGPQKK